MHLTPLGHFVVAIVILVGYLTVIGVAAYLLGLAGAP